MKIVIAQNIQKHAFDIRDTFLLVVHGIKIPKYIGCHRSYPNVEFLHEYTQVRNKKPYNTSHTDEGLSWFFFHKIISISLYYSLSKYCTIWRYTMLTFIDRTTVKLWSKNDYTLCHRLVMLLGLHIIYA